MRWNTEVVAAEWNDDDGIWSVTLRWRRRSDDHSYARGRSITAVGQLNRPHIPEFDGADTFEGPSFHSAAWDHSVDVTGKRVALIGAGASGFQIAPAIADRRRAAHRVPADRPVDVPERDVSRRSRRRCALGDAPPAVLREMVPIPGAVARIGQGARRRRRRPELSTRSRRLGRQRHQCRRADDVLAVDHQPGRRGQRAAGQGDARLSGRGKRTLQDNGSWLRTLQRDNVDLVRTPIARITPGGVVTDGRGDARSGHHRVRHRISAHRCAVAAKGDRPQRNRPARNVGQPPVRLPRASPCRNSPTSSSSTGPELTWPTAAA